MACPTCPRTLRALRAHEHWVLYVPKYILQTNFYILQNNFTILQFYYTIILLLLSDVANVANGRINI